VYGEQLVVSFDDLEVTFLVDVVVVTTGETSDMGIVPYGACLEDDGLSGGSRDSLA